MGSISCMDFQIGCAYALYDEGLGFSKKGTYAEVSRFYWSITELAG